MRKEKELIGEWIKGPFLCTTIEGFITNVSNGYCKIIVKKINDVEEYIPPRLQMGSVHCLPIKVIDEFYTHLNYEQQLSLIETAKMLGDKEWVSQLTEQFYNPFEIDVMGGDRIPVYSTVYKRVVNLEDESRTKLYKFYQEAIQKGLSTRLEGPEDINNSDALDMTISSIVLVGRNPEGIKYVRSLLKK